MISSKGPKKMDLQIEQLTSQVRELSHQVEANGRILREAQAMVRTKDETLDRLIVTLDMLTRGNSRLHGDEAENSESV